MHMQCSKRDKDSYCHDAVLKHCRAVHAIVRSAAGVAPTFYNEHMLMHAID
jgi:hypothetical protein